MRMESGYLVTAKSEQAIERIMVIWGISEKEGDCSFEDFDNEVLDVMEKVIKLVHCMEKSGQKDEFAIAGKCETDYDCSVFTIEYTGNEPQIKASYANPEENEARYYEFSDADYDEIPKILKRNKNRSFKQAIKDDLPLGGYLDVSYEEWVKSILNE